MKANLPTILAAGLLTTSAVFALAIPASTLDLQGLAAVQTTHPTNAELCGASGCIMTGTDENGRPIFAGYGCEHCYEDTPQQPQKEAAVPAKTIAIPAHAVQVRAVAAPTQSMTNAQLCGISGCIMKGTDANGRPIFEGYNCDHCWDDVASSTTLPSAIATTTVTAIVEKTITLGATSCIALTITNTITAMPQMATTATATIMAQVTVTATQYVEDPVKDGCHRIGTLDQGGATWIGPDCKGDSIYHGEEGCSRVGTLDNGGAIWVGRGCLSG